MLNTRSRVPRVVPVNIPRARRIIRSEIDLEIKRCPVMYQSHSTRGVLQSIDQRYCYEVDELRPHVELFTGLSGTGKSETYTWLANVLFNPTTKEEQSMILRVHPCNTISDKHDFAQLVGAPAGTVGSDDTTGILIDFAAKLEGKEKDPTVYISGIFVFEEVDKVAYDQFMVQLMEIFDSGVVHSAHTGSVYSVRKMIFIMSCNGIGVKKLKNPNLRKNLKDIANLEEAVRDEVQVKLCNGQESTVARIGHIRLYLPFNDKQQKKIIARIITRFIQATFRQRKGAGPFVANERTVYIAPTLVAFIQRFWNPKSNCRSLRNVTSTLRSDIAESYDVCPVMPFRIEFDQHTHKVSLRDSSDGPTITFQAPHPRPIKVVESDDGGSEEDADQTDWRPLTAKVVQEAVRQNGKSIHHVSPFLHKSVPAVVRGEYTGAMECITSATNEVCSYLPGGEDGKAMDLIRHPGEPNSWALALAVDRKQVQFVINLHTYIASGLAEKQMVELKNEIREYKQEISQLIAKQATDMSEMRILIEGSISEKLSRKDITMRCNRCKIQEPTMLLSGKKMFGCAKKSIDFTRRSFSFVPSNHALCNYVSKHFVIKTTESGMFNTCRFSFLHVCLDVFFF